MLGVSFRDQILENTHPVIPIKLDFRADNPAKVPGKHLTHQPPDSGPGHDLVSIPAVVGPQYLLVFTLVHNPGEEGDVVVEQTVNEEVLQLGEEGEAGDEGGGEEQGGAD